MSVWKTLNDETPERFETVMVITDQDMLVEGVYDPDCKVLRSRCGSLGPIDHKLWARRDDIVAQALAENNID